MNSKFDENKLMAGDLSALLTKGADTVLIDLLSPDHFARQHTPDAQNACVFQVSSFTLWQAPWVQCKLRPDRSEHR
jgi:rhodanese-related sulfurtransferase